MKYMKKLHWSDIPNTIVYDMMELIKQYNIPQAPLERLILDALEHFGESTIAYIEEQHEFEKDEAYEKGRSDGYDDGKDDASEECYDRAFEKGKEEAQKELVPFQTMTFEEAYEMRDNAFEKGFEKGYTCGVRWQEPPEEFAHLKKHRIEERI